MQVNVFINMTCVSLIQSSYDNQRAVKEKRDTNQLNHSTADKTVVLGHHNVFSK